MRILIRNSFDPGSGMENSDPGSGTNIPDPQHWSDQRKTIFPLECGTLVTCLVHVGAGVADGGYGKLVLQPQTQHIFNYKKSVLRQPFMPGQTNLFQNWEHLYSFLGLYCCRLPKVTT
jgi:hypothetical protein